MSNNVPPINYNKPQGQLEYDETNATTDAKEMNWLKGQATSEGGHLTAAQAEQAETVARNFKNNEAAVTNDIGALAATGDKADVAHAADYMNQLNNIVQQGGSWLEQSGGADAALTSSGSSSSEFHQLLQDANAANSNNLDAANQLAPNSDMNYTGAVNAANTNAQATGSEPEPYASGHTPAPTGIADTYTAPSTSPTTASPVTAPGAPGTSPVGPPSSPVGPPSSPVGPPSSPVGPPSSPVGPPSSPVGPPSSPVGPPSSPVTPTPTAPSPTGSSPGTSPSSTVQSPQAINYQNAKGQLTYDKSNAANDVKEINWIKQQIGTGYATPEQAKQLQTAMNNFKNNVGQVNNDIAALAATGDKGDVAHAADYINQLNNNVQSAVHDMVAHSALDRAWAQIGAPNNVETLQWQITEANSNNLNAANELAPNSDPSNQDAVNEANTDSTPGSSEPYAAGHQAAPSSVFDTYQAPTSSPSAS